MFFRIFAGAGFLWSVYTLVCQIRERNVLQLQGGVTLLSLSGRVDSGVLERTVCWNLRLKRRNVVFVLAVEQWTSFTPSVGSWRTPGSSPNQPPCASRRRSTMYGPVWLPQRLCFSGDMMLVPSGHSLQLYWTSLQPRVSTSKSDSMVLNQSRGWDPPATEGV